MIRTIIEASKSNLTFQLPESFIGEKVEIVAFILEEESENILSIDDSMMTSLLSESVLSKEWLSKAEDEAWKNLLKVK